MSHGGSQPSPAPRPRANRIMRWRKWIKPFITRHGTPENIAWGMVIGLLVAFSPTLGFQILLAYFIATAFKVSRAAALVPIWITSPVTATPIYVFTYSIGAWFIGGPSVGEVRRQLTQLLRRVDGYDTFDLPAKIREAMSLGADVIIPMLLGGLIVGILCSLAAYPATLWAVRRFRTLREQRKSHRRKRFRFRSGQDQRDK